VDGQVSERQIAVMSAAGQVRALTPAELERYHADGAAHIAELVDAATAERLLRAADERRAQPGPNSSAMADQGRFWEERESYLLNADMADFVHHSGLAAQAARAMNATEVRFYFDHIFMLRENTAKNQYYWHQDMPYWACDGQQLCSFWLALTDCTLESGALEFVLGTDQGPQYEPVPFADDELITESPPPEALPPSYEQERDRWRIVSWDIKAGDAILFNGRIMHSSRGNHSLTQRRVAYSTRWIGPDMVFRKRPGFQDPVTLPPPGLLYGEPLARNPRFPLLWSQK
jgi:ectoine hydroxylase-related dioxygenase (phytanoyl-CoA dioxygenase family)